MALELLIQHGKKYYYPVVQDGIEWTTERKGAAGKLTFKVLADSTLLISEGDAVRLKYNGSNVFYGFVFTLKRSESDFITVTAYDQLRYLKNKDTYCYTKTATNLIKQIAKDFNLNLGTIVDTKYVIPSRIEDGQTLFDIIKNALELTNENTGNLFVLYDSFGKLTLKSIEDMKVNILIDEETARSYTYDSSIDKNTYNQVKLYFDNKKSGKRDVWIAKDSNHINEWGLLQLYESIDEGENGKDKVDKLLKLYNSKSKSLTVNNAFGNINVRAGSMVVVKMDLGDMKISNYMLVESCKHIFNSGEHWMNLKLRGGDINNG